MTTRTLLALTLILSLGPSNVHAEALWINTGFSMYAVDSASPGTFLSGPTSYSGTVGGEFISAFDFHPTTHALYGYTHTSGRLYTIDLSTGVSTLVGTSTTTANAFLGMTFEGSTKIRIVHVSGAQFTISPTTGSLLSSDATTTEDGLMGVAFDATTNTTYGMEDGTGNLHRIGSFGGAPNSPSTGLTELVGATTVFTSRTYNMDISPATGTAYVDDGGGGAGGTLNLYSVSLGTGAKTYLGPLALPVGISNGIAVQPVPEPAAGSLVAVAMLLIAARRRSESQAGLSQAGNEAADSECHWHPASAK